MELACPFLVLHSASTPTWPSMQKLSDPSPFGVVWRLHCIVMIEEIIGHWQLIQPQSPSPALRRTFRVGLKITTLLSYCSPGNQPSSLGVSITTTTKTPFLFFSLRKFQGVWEVCARNKDGTQIHISYYKSQ